MIKEEFNRVNYGTAVIENEEDFFEFIKKSNVFNNLPKENTKIVTYSFVDKSITIRVSFHREIFRNIEIY